MRTPVVALVSVFLGLLLVGPAHAAPAVVDTGTFIVYQGDKAIGTESFSVTVDGDRLHMLSKVSQQVPTGDNETTLEKELILVASRFDFAIKTYNSTQKFRGRTLGRGVSVAETTMTVYREVDGRGEGTVLALPPGKLFLIDPMLFSLFEYMCLSLKDHTFDTRPISVLVLGPTDSLLEAHVTDLGKESIRWGQKPVQARKLKIGDDRTTFEAWVGPTGGLLRLALPGQELRVERSAPKVKARNRSGSSDG